MTGSWYFSLLLNLSTCQRLPKPKKMASTSANFLKVHLSWKSWLLRFKIFIGAVICCHNVPVSKVRRVSKLALIIKKGVGRILIYCVVLTSVSLFFPCQMPSQEASPARTSPPVPANCGYSDEDYRAMLSKIANLQEENVLLQQRLQVRCCQMTSW